MLFVYRPEPSKNHYLNGCFLFAANQLPPHDGHVLQEITNINFLFLDLPTAYGLPVFTFFLFLFFLTFFSGTSNFVPLKIYFTFQWKFFRVTFGKCCGVRIFECFFFRTYCSFLGGFTQCSMKRMAFLRGGKAIQYFWGQTLLTTTTSRKIG